MMKEEIASNVLRDESRMVLHMNATNAKNGYVKKLSKNIKEIIDRRTHAYA